MTDDIKALREALEAGPTAGAWTQHKFDTRMLRGIFDSERNVVFYMKRESDEDAAYIAAAHPDRIRRVLDRLEAAERDAAMACEDADRYAYAKTLEGQVVVMETLKVLGAAHLDQALDDAMADESIDAAMKEQTNG